MILQGMPDGLELAQPVRCGNPWHGVIAGAVLTTTTGGITMAWPQQPDSADAYLYVMPGLAAPVTPADETALGMAWRNTAIMSGWWARELYGRALPGASKAWLLADAGTTHAVNASGLTINDVAGVKKLAGDLVFRPLVVNGGLPAITQSLAPFTLPDQDRAQLDIVAMSRTGDKALVGVWPTTYKAEAVTYTQAAACRAMAHWVYGGAQYRLPPMSVISLAVSTAAVSAASLKTEADIAKMTHEHIVPITQVIPDLQVIDSSVSDWTYSGPPDNPTFCSWRTESRTYGWVDNPGYQNSEIERTFEKIVGAYHKADGTVAWVVLRYRHDYAWHADYMGSGGAGEQTRTVGGEYVEGELECVGLTTGWTPDLGVGVITWSGSGSSVRAVELVVDGTVKSSVVETWAFAQNESTPFHYTSRTLVVDGYSMPYNGLSGGSLPGSNPDGDLPYDAPPQLSTVAAYRFAQMAVHAVRYSNNAWGLAMNGLSLSIHPKNAYRAGVVNLVTGTRAAAEGYITIPGDGHISYLYTNRFAAVEPEYGDIFHSASLACYV